MSRYRMICEARRRAWRWEDGPGRAVLRDPMLWTVQVRMPPDAEVEPSMPVDGDEAPVRARAAALAAERGLPVALHVRDTVRRRWRVREIYYPDGTHEPDEPKIKI